MFVFTYSFENSLVILGGLRFVLEKQVEDSIKSIDNSPRAPGEPSLEFIATQAGVQMGSGPGTKQGINIFKNN